MKTILETEMLLLREFNIDDSSFILELVNSPQWIEFIGNKGITSIDDANNYLLEGPLKSYDEFGFGLWMVQLKDSQIPIGMCGLIKREVLEDVDIGFGMLPEYFGKGYGYEMANATIQYAKDILELQRVIGITDATNEASIRLLNKIGLNYEKTLDLADDDQVLVFVPKSDQKEQE